MNSTLWPDANEITDLTQHQAQQLSLACRAKVGLFTGAPGTGKTYTLGRLINYLVSQYGAHAVKVAAPTGKAAIRATQSLRSAGSNVTATTIHRLLKCVMTDTGFAFVHNRGNPMTALFYFVDEASMLGNGLMSSFMSAIPDGGHLMLIGDHHQLPPVEKGAVLRDFIEAGIPHGDLTEILRNSGQIVLTCASIRRGDGFVACTSDSPARFGTEQNLMMMEAGSDVAVRASVERVYRQVLERELVDAVWGMQTIVYMNEGSPVARKELNIAIQDIVNPDGEQFFHIYRKGDKVICLKNATYQWKVDGEQSSAMVANGQQGRVVSSDKTDVIVEMETDIANTMQRVTVSRTRLLEDWDLGYAITVHRCLHLNTLVETSKGMQRIGKCDDVGIVRDGDYSKTEVNEVGPALKITCEGGYGFTATDYHRCEVFRDEFVMVEASEVVVGDWMRLKLGVGIDRGFLVPLHCLPKFAVRPNAKRHCLPEKVTSEVAEFFGLMVADGTIYKGGFRLTKRHLDVVERFRDLCEILFGTPGRIKELKYCHAFISEVNSRMIVEWLLGIDGLAPKKKNVPDCILQSPIEIQASFLRGLYEDGTVNIKDGVCDHVELTSYVPNVLKDVQVMLLRFGIASSISKKGVHLYVYGKDCKIFGDRIGFISSFKDKRLANFRNTESRKRIPLSWNEASLLSRNPVWVKQNAKIDGFVTKESARRMKTESRWLYDRGDGWHWVRVKSIEQTQCETVCLNVPSTGRFFQNGFYHGNSQGSQWPITVVAVETSSRARFMGSRQIVYTAISRAEDYCICIGRRADIQQDCQVNAIQKRVTRLAEKISERIHDGQAGVPVQQG